LLDALSTAEASDIDQDVFETLKDALALTDQSMSTQLMPVACEPPLNEVAGLKLLNRVTSESRKLRATLQGLVQSERLRHSRSTAHGTRLDSHRLARVGLGETKLFLKSELKTAPNTAIHLLLDRSYSMNAKLLDPQGQTSGTRLAVTLSASLALALALEGVPGVNPGITAFPGQEADSVYRILDYGQRVTSRASAFTLTASGGTPMTEAIWFGAAALLRCREPRKVLLVLTDGQPDELASTLDILQRCRESGIETVGIGLGLEVSHLFPKALRIHALTELRTQLFELSKTLLLAK
jgi:nitric oxide reductase activation protein